MKIARCPHCNSPWVVWNWIIPWGGDYKEYLIRNFQCWTKDKVAEETKISIADAYDYFMSMGFGHECHDCGNAFCTKLTPEVFKELIQIRNGLPYRLVMFRGRIRGYYRYYILHKLFKWPLDKCFPE